MMSHRTVVTGLLLLAGSLSNIASSNDSFTLKKGVLNIGRSDVLQGDVIKLRGECEFYWNQLLEPKDFADSVKPDPTYVSIPSSWYNYRINGEKLPNHGYATYRFVIKLPSDCSQQLYGLKLSTVHSCYKLWVNGTLLLEVGQVGKTKETTTPAFKYIDLPFSAEHSTTKLQDIEIVLQVANFHNQRAGMHYPLFFGTHSNILKETRKMDIINLIVIGIILLIGLNHLSLFFFRRNDISNLYFGFVCLVLMIRNISTGDRIITSIFPNIGWELLLKFDGFSAFATVPLFAIFFYSLYRSSFPRFMLKAIVWLGALIGTLIILTPAAFFSNFNLLFQIYMLVGGMYLTFGVLLSATLRKHPYAVWSFIGMVILYGTAFNDVIFAMGKVNSTILTPYGLAAFMLIQSISINRKSARAITDNEVLGYQLRKERDNLERNVEERTQELKSQHEEILQHRKKEQVENWKNTGVAKINEVVMRNKDSYRMLCERTLVELVKYVDLQLGDIFLVCDDDEGQLEMVASYGLQTGSKINRARIPSDSGLLGATFTKKIVQHITDIPQNYVSINSGLGSAQPKSLFIVPLVFDNKVLGAMEFASFNDFNLHEMEFIEAVAGVIAGNINTAMMNEQNIKLIQQFETKSLEMREKEEAMRQNIEDLEIIREQYENLKNEVEAMRKG